MSTGSRAAQATVRYMLDTNTVSRIIKGATPALQNRLRHVPMAHLCVSSITEAELLYGLARKPEAVTLHRIVHEFLLRVDILPWDSEAAHCYGLLRAELERGGVILGNLDLLIAAHAQAAAAVLVTNDRAFLRVSGVRVEDWVGC